MSYALVGSAGAVNTTGLTLDNTPAYGQSPTASNLLVLMANVYASSTLPTAPAGWSIAKQSAAALPTASIFYKVAAGGDTAPTIAAITGGRIVAELYEFSGNATSSPLDQTGTGAGLGATIAVTAAAIDAAAGELIVTASAAQYSAAATKTLSDSYNNGATATSSTNNAVSSTDHYTFGFGVTTGNAAADSNTFAETTTSLFGTSHGVIASFLLPTTAGLPFQFAPIPFMSPGRI